MKYYDKKVCSESAGGSIFSSYFMKEPKHTVEIIEVRLNEINMERIQNKGE